MSERPMSKLCKASVMIFDDAERKWKTAGRTPGLSGVSIYQHVVENTFRVIARKEQDGEVVINCSVVPQLKYNRATPTFHQWRDGVRTVYGLNFSTPDEANTFAGIMESALETLRNSGGPPQAPPGPSPAEIEAKRREQEILERQQREREERERQERERQENERLARERAAAPAAPPPPSGGAPPPPPPPPPPPAPTAAPAAPAAPPSGGGGSNQGGLAAALQAAKLKKASVPERTESAPPPSSGGGGGGMDMMAELQKKMQRRRAAAQESGDSGKPPPEPAPKPAANSSTVEIRRPSWQPKTASNSTNSSPSVSRKSSLALPAGESNTTRRWSVGNKKTNASSDMEQVKQEILSEMKSEMQKMKEEIIQAIRNELRK